MLSFNLNTDPYDEGLPMFKFDTLKIRPGLTVMVGCNGSGRTTLLKQMEEQCKSDENIVYYAYDVAEHISDIDAACKDIEDILRKINTAVESRTDKSLVFLLDNGDMGMSIDLVDRFKEVVLTKITPRADSAQIPLYIVVAATEYEICSETDCLNVTSFNRLIFNNYPGYRKCILEGYRAILARKQKIEKSKGA